MKTGILLQLQNQKKVIFLSNLILCGNILIIGAFTSKNSLFFSFFNSSFLSHYQINDYSIFMLFVCSFFICLYLPLILIILGANLVNPSKSLVFNHYYNQTGSINSSVNYSLITSLIAVPIITCLILIPTLILNTTLIYFNNSSIMLTEHFILLILLIVFSIVIILISSLLTLIIKSKGFTYYFLSFYFILSILSQLIACLINKESFGQFFTLFDHNFIMDISLTNQINFLFISFISILSILFSLMIFRLKNNYLSLNEENFVQLTKLEEMKYD